MNNLNIDEFQKVEIRVGTVLSAEKAEGADKLLKLIFDFGSAEILNPPFDKLRVKVQDDKKERDSSPEPALSEANVVQNDKSGEIAANSASSRNDNIARLPELVEKYPGRDVRQIMSAIADYFPDPSVLVGRQICVCTNLEPKVFRGYESQGMILAVDNPNGGITFIGPEEKVPTGTRIH